MKITRFFPILLLLFCLVLPSCFHDSKDQDYNDWRIENTKAFNDSMALRDEMGQLVYEELTPVWDNSFSVLIRWHNDRSQNTNKIFPLSTSTCEVKYTLTTITGDTLDQSSSFTCVPNQMVTGFMAALTNMNVNDTVTVVIPYTAGYGMYGYGSVLPYSTLVFGIRLEDIIKLM